MIRKIISAWCTLYDDDGEIVDDFDLKFDECFEEDEKKRILERFKKMGYNVIPTFYAERKVDECR